MSYESRVYVSRIVKGDDSTFFLPIASFELGAVGREFKEIFKNELPYDRFEGINCTSGTSDEIISKDFYGDECKWESPVTVLKYIYKELSNGYANFGMDALRATLEALDKTFMANEIVVIHFGH